MKNQRVAKVAGDSNTDDVENVSVYKTETTSFAKELRGLHPHMKQGIGHASFTE